MCDKIKTVKQETTLTRDKHGPPKMGQDHQKTIKRRDLKMEISILSQKRGILSLYDGKKYIIFSQCLGVVAESSKIERIDDENHHEKAVKIIFEICDWCGYWDLKTIITRGIKKLENQYITKDVNISFKTIGDMGQNYLERRLIVKTEKY